MHKDDFEKTRKDQIRLSRKLRGMKAKTKSKPMNQSPYNNFRLCIPAAYARHAFMPLFGGKNICHEPIAKLLRTAEIKPFMLNICMSGTAG